jgi:hypothetical protein
MATEIKLGPDGPNYAASKMTLMPTQISGAHGTGAQMPAGEISPRKPGMIGVPTPPPTAKKEKSRFIPNMLRVAVEEKWGHPYGYFEALAANNLDERHVLYKGQMITIPARGKRAKMLAAKRWRNRLGSD